MIDALSFNTRGLRANDRCDLVLNYCEQLVADFSILQKMHANTSSLESIKESQYKGLTVLAKKDAPTKEEIITDWDVYILQDQRY